MVLDLFPRLQGTREAARRAACRGGEQQMLAIGRGLMARPQLLLLDEPSLGMAPNLVSDIFAALRRINQERRMTMLIVEQNAHVALKNDDVRLRIAGGKDRAVRSIGATAPQQGSSWNRTWVVKASNPVYASLYRRRRNMKRSMKWTWAVMQVTAVLARWDCSGLARRRTVRASRTRTFWSARTSR